MTQSVHIPMDIHTPLPGCATCLPNGSHINSSLFLLLRTQNSLRYSKCCRCMPKSPGPCAMTVSRNVKEIFELTKIHIKKLLEVCLCVPHCTWTDCLSGSPRQGTYYCWWLDITKCLLVPWHHGAFCQRCENAPFNTWFHMVSFSLIWAVTNAWLTWGPHFFSSLNKQHDGAYLAAQLAKFLEAYGIGGKVCSVITNKHC